MRVCHDVGCAGYWPEGVSREHDPESGHDFLLPESGYLAVAFTNTTGLHYGWVDVGVLGFSATGVIYGWAWESDPDTPVTIVPEPESVGLMVLFAGLIWLRQMKRERVYERCS